MIRWADLNQRKLATMRASPAVRCKRKLYDFRTETWTTLSGLF